MGLPRTRVQAVPDGQAPIDADIAPWLHAALGRTL
jgi:hypothetical protein